MSQKYFRQARIISQLRAVLIGSASLGLVSCAMHSDQKSYVEDVRGSHKSPLSSLNPNKKLHPAVAQAIGLMRDNKFVEASQFINQALQNEPQSISLHLLNALVYEKLAEVGDSSRLELASVGYQNALNLDPNNLFAMTQLGKIKFKNKQFDQAQELFANSLLIKPNDPNLLQELAAASYYAYDAETALASIDQAIILEPQSPLAHRSAAMIHAALGDMKRAQYHQAEYQKLAKNDPDGDKVASRLQDWEFLYSSGRIKLTAESPNPDPNPGPNVGENSDAGNGDGPSSGSAEQSDQSDQSDDHTNPALAINALNAGPLNQGGSSSSVSFPGATPQANPHHDEQVIIDCYLLQITEEATTSKGQNLLESLQVTLNPASWTRTVMNAKGTLFSGSGGQNTSNSFEYNAVDPGPSAANAPATLAGAATGTGGAIAAVNNGSLRVNTFATGISWAGLTYNLNIANAIEKRSEIIGRPTLHAFVGKQASFFSGEELVTGLSGTNGGSLVRYPLGTALFVTVNKVDNDEVTLSIAIEGSVNSDPSLNINGQTLTINKTKVDTTAKMLLGETLMLGGIYQQTNQDSNNGVPGLKQIPIAQYFFSKEQTKSTRNSIVVLLTPRSTDAVKIAVSRAMSRKKNDKVHELFVRHPDWYQSHPNLVKVLKHLVSDPIIYYEFRNSDVLPPHWGWEPTFDNKLDQILAFAYY